jgi:hypothetical protein
MKIQQRPVSCIQPKPIRWLWPGRIPAGKVTVIYGDPSIGKTCLTLDLAARVSSGAAWPDATAEANTNTPGRVLLFNNEDHSADTIRPRLEHAGADLERVHLVGNLVDMFAYKRLLNLTCDGPYLQEAIHQLKDVRLVIIDSLASYLGPTPEPNGDRIRMFTAGLTRVAAETGVAIVIIASGTRPKLPVKHIWKVDCDVIDPDRRVWLPVHFNSGPRPTALAYRITADGIEWESPQQPIPTHRLAGIFPRQERSWRKHAAATWLQNYLQQGPRQAQEVLEAACAQGWSIDQIKRAKLALGATSYKQQHKDGH